MSERKFEGILEYLCGDIAFKSERNEVREELYDHLMSIYETNLACGMTEDEAEENAIDHLGDTLALKKDLNTIHQKNPLKMFTNGLGAFTAYSFFLLLVLITPINDFQDRYWEIAIAAVFAFCAWGLVSVSRISGLFKLLSISLTIYLLESMVWYSACLFNEEAQRVIVPATTLSYLAIYCFTQIALLNLLKINNLKLGSKTSLICSIIVTVVFSLAVVFGRRFITEHLNKSPSYLLLLFHCSLFVQYFFYKQVFNTLNRSGVKLNFETSIFKKAVASLLTVIVFILSIVCAEYMYFKQSNDKNTDTDNTVTASESRNRIEQVLSEYGVCEKYLSILPDTEIEKYKDLKSPETNSLIGENIRTYDHQDVFYDIDEVEREGNSELHWKSLNSEEWVFPLRQENGETVYRLMRITDLSMPYEDYKEFSDYIAGVKFFNIWIENERFGESIDVDLSADTLLIADESDGKVTYRKPLKIFVGINDSIVGCEFKIQKNTYLIYSETLIMKDDADEGFISSFMEFSFKKKPVLLKYRSAFNICDRYSKRDSISNAKYSVTSNFFDHNKTD